MKKFLQDSVIVMLMLVCIFLLSCMLWLGYRMIVEKVTTVEVENYTVGAEVSQTDYTAYYKKNTGTVTKYVLGVRNDDFSAVFSVSAETYAKYAVGDVVEVMVRVMENKYNNWYEYDLIGQALA